jgi:hypothetical protein
MDFHQIPLEQSDLYVSLLTSGTRHNICGKKSRQFDPRRPLLAKSGHLAVQLV